MLLHSILPESTIKQMRQHIDYDKANKAKSELQVVELGKCAWLEAHVHAETHAGGLLL